MGMGDLDGFGGRTPSSFVNPSSSTRSSWRCVLLRRHQKPGRVGLCHQTGRIRKSLVSVRCPRQIPTQNGGQGDEGPGGRGCRRTPRAWASWGPTVSASGQLRPSRRFVTGPHPTARPNSAPPFSLSLGPRLALLTVVLPSLSAVLQQAQTLHARLFIVPSLLARDSEPSPFPASVSLCPAAFPRDALFGNQSIPCAPISNSHLNPEFPAPGKRSGRSRPPHRMHGPGTARGHATRGIMRHRGSHYLRDTRYGGHKRCPHHHAACDGEGGGAAQKHLDARTEPASPRVTVTVTHRGFFLSFRHLMDLWVLG